MALKVVVERFGGGDIEANKETWIVIHGRGSYTELRNRISFQGA